MTEQGKTEQVAGRWTYRGGDGPPMDEVREWWHDFHAQKEKGK